MIGLHKKSLLSWSAVLKEAIKAGLILKSKNNLFLPRCLPCLPCFIRDLCDCFGKRICFVPDDFGAFFEVDNTTQ